MKSLLSRLVMIAVVVSFAAAGWGQTSTAATEPEIHRLFVEDQKDRQPKEIDWAKVEPRDRQRRERAHELLKAGMLKTGRDFQDAAFIFQHGQAPDDYLLAHILATVAIAKGNAEARWIAAATLDRYLQALKQPQVFGTQYSGSSYTQEPYNRTLLGDPLRQQLCVPPIAIQEKIAEAFSKNERVQIPRSCAD